MSVARFSSPLIALLLTVPSALADEAAVPAISPELQNLIKLLDADDFADRASASEQLAKLGRDALPALEEGVRSSSPEVATRSFDLLQQLLEKGDDAAKAAARSSLDKLSQGNDRVAGQAKKMLEPKPVPLAPNDATGRIRILGGGGAIRIIGPRIARAAPIPVPIAPAIDETVVRRVMSISTSVGPDGVKTINVDEDGKKVKIVEDPKKGIEGEYTETKDGKEATVEFAAKDADELKTKHPEAFKLYERFAKGGGAVRAEIAVEGAALEPALRDELLKKGVAPAALAPVGREKFEELLKKLEEQIASVTKELEASKADKDGREAVLTRKLESYSRIREVYQRQIKEFEAKEAKEEQAPKKPVEPRSPLKIDVKEVEVEFEGK